MIVSLGDPVLAPYLSQCCKGGLAGSLIVMMETTMCKRYAEKSENRGWLVIRGQLMMDSLIESQRYLMV